MTSELPRRTRPRAAREFCEGLPEAARGSAHTRAEATAPVREYFEKRAQAFDRLYEQGAITRLLRSGPTRGRDLAASIVAQHQAADILDVGCGPGRVAEAVMDAGAETYVGIDLAPRMLALARARLDRFDSVRLIEGDFVDLDLHQTFAVVLALGLFDYITAPETAARWLYAHCASTLVASFTRWDWVKGPIRHLHYELLHRCPIFDYSEARIEAMLVSAGFSRVGILHRGRRGFIVAAFVPAAPSTGFRRKANRPSDASHTRTAAAS